jgi:hypothetical protein
MVEKRKGLMARLLTEKAKETPQVQVPRTIGNIYNLKKKESWLFKYRPPFIVVAFCFLAPVFFVQDTPEPYTKLIVSPPIATVKVLSQREIYENYIRIECEKRKFPFKLAVAVMLAESEGNPKARNINYDKKDPKKELSRDIGLFQLNSIYIPDFIDWYGGDGPCDPYRYSEDNIKLGVAHLAALYKQFGSIRLALMAYNCGGPRVIRNQIPESTLKYLDRVIMKLAVL